MGEILGQKPTAAYALSLMGGIFVLLGGCFWAFWGLISLLAFPLMFHVRVELFGFFVFGIVMIIGAVLMNRTPTKTKEWGIVILILGVLSLFGVTTTLGGILAIIGGVLAIIWEPSEKPSIDGPLYGLA